ncbi:MAG: cytochrome ubiquinol oxidase subunit I [Dehalococcoidia bacterium]|jgi:cytochrome d ubiquinol oxidase subunit I
MEAIALDLARAQFAVTTIFHMIWPLLSIGLSLMMVVMEILWLKTNNEIYYRQVRFWSAIFIMAFGIGVASGVPLELEFGTNWSRFSTVAGDIFGTILAFEAAMSFALEAAFLAIFFFGWGRVSKGVHLFSNIMVALGASLSAFWIMSANSWMQTPAGVQMQGGKMVITNYLQAVFNPDLPIAFIHIWVASVETTLFFVAGICAWYILRKQNIDFFLKAFKVMVVIGILVAPLQVFLGDASGLAVLKNQPAKAAAMEAHWTTNPPDSSASWVAIGWPDQAAQKNVWEVKVPYMLSLLSDRSLTGQVTGLKDFPLSDQPPVTLPFYAFRIMVVLGILMVLLVLWALWLWYRRMLRSEAVAQNRLFWLFWIYALPSGFIATECGWIVREMGRQPWIIYGILRTSDGVSPIGVATVATSLAIFTLIYLVLLGLFVYFTRKILINGPDLTSPLPGQGSSMPPPKIDADYGGK